MAEGTKVGGIFYSVDADTAPLVSSTEKLDKALDGASKSFKKTDDAAGKMNTRMRETAKAAKEASTNTKSAADSMQSLYKIAAAYVTLGTLKAMADMADAYGQNASRIKNATTSTEEYNLVQERLLKTANATYRALGEAQEVYLATSDVLKDLGYNTSQVLDITDSFSYALVRDAARADQATSAMDAYSKALQKGRIEGDAWASIMAATPSIVNGIAEATGKTAQEIRKLGVEGKLSVEALNEGLLRSLGDNEKAAAAMSTSTADAVTAMKNSLQVFIGKVDEASGASGTFAETVGEFSKLLQDPKTIEAAAGFAEGIVKWFNWIIEGAQKTHDFVKWMAEGIAATLHGAASDDIVRLEQELGNFQKARNRSGLARLFDGYTDAELDSEIAKRKGQIADYYKWQDEQARLNKPPATTPAPASAPRPTVSAVGPGNGKPVGRRGKTDAEREMEAQARAAASYLTALRDQASAVRDLTAAERIEYDVREKKIVLSEKELALAKAYAATIDYQHNLDVISELALETEKAAMSSRQLAEYNALSKLNPAATPEQVETVRQMANELWRMQEAKSKIGEQNAREYVFGGTDPLSGGEFDNQDKRYADEVAKEQERYAAELERLREFMELKGLTQQEYYALYEEGAQRHAERLQQIEDARMSLQLRNYSTAFGAMADIMKTAQGEQSGIYKAMFAASKAFAVADATINAYNAISKAWASAPFPANLAAVAATVPQVMSVVSAISGASISGGRQYGGSVSAGNMYRINETGAPEVFNAANGRQYMLPNQRGEVVSNADATGGAGGTAPNVTVNIIEDASKAGSVQQGGTDTDMMIEVFVSNIMSDGPAAQALQSKFGLATVGR